MDDFDDLRSLTEDDDDFSFDDIDFDEDIPFDRMGKAIGEEDDDDGDDVWADTGSDDGGGSLAVLDNLMDSPLFGEAQTLVFSMNSLERMILSGLMFAIILVLGLGLLMATGRFG